jgi:hypothetical protein
MDTSQDGINTSALGAPPYVRPRSESAAGQTRTDLPFK